MELSEEQARHVYEQLRAIPADEWENSDGRDLRETLEENGITVNFDDKKLTSGLRIFGRIAHEHDEDTFVEAAREGEVPPMELSTEEMQTLRGGGNIGKVLYYMLEELKDGGEDGI